MIAIRPVPPGRLMFMSFAKTEFSASAYVSSEVNVLGIHSEGMKLPKPTKNTIMAPTSIGLVNKNLPCPLNRAATPCRRPPPRVYGIRRLIGNKEIPPKTRKASPRVTMVALYPNLPSIPETRGGKMAPPTPVPANKTPEASPRWT
jgi:hypothetical protein